MTGWGTDPDKWMIRQSRQSGNWHVWPPRQAFYQEHRWFKTAAEAFADFRRQTVYPADPWRL